MKRVGASEPTGPVEAIAMHNVTEVRPCQEAVNPKATKL
jgi:hypothetical protein